MHAEPHERLQTSVDLCKRHCAQQSSLATFITAARATSGVRSRSEHDLEIFRPRDKLAFCQFRGAVSLSTCHCASKMRPWNGLRCLPSGAETSTMRNPTMQIPHCKLFPCTLMYCQGCSGLCCCIGSQTFQCRERSGAWAVDLATFWLLALQKYHYRNTTTPQHKPLPIIWSSSHSRESAQLAILKSRG